MSSQAPPIPTEQLLRELASRVDFVLFRRAWQQLEAEQAEQGFIAACYESVARQANSEGEYYLAYDAADHGLRCAALAGFPPHRLVAAKSTALARSGATAEAQRVMEEFLSAHPADSSVCSAKARLLRDLALSAGEEARSMRMRDAAQWAARAKDLTRENGDDWSYPANQEVQFLYLAGDRERAWTKAREVIEFIEHRDDSGSMWNQTNLAEMWLVLGELERAGAHYAQAAGSCMRASGDLAANRAVAALLLAELSADPALLDQWFPKPVLVIFAGHIPDIAGRATPRLPEPCCRKDGPAASLLAQRIAEWRAIEGICAGAPGGDILFAEAILSTGAKLTIIEPFARGRIRAVAAACGHDWLPRLDRVYDKAAHIQSITCADDVDEDIQCDYANRVMLGSALLRARRLHGELRAIVLWDQSGDTNPKPGGTGHFAQLCREAGIPMEIIHPNSFSY